MKCNQPCPGFELMSPCPFPTMITITPRTPPQNVFTNHIYIYHYHHVVLLARISLTLSRHFSLSFITSGRSSGLLPVSSHSCCMYVRAGRPAFAWPYVGVHRSTSLMSSSQLLQQCSACNETQFLRSSGRVDTAVWMHHLDANKIAGEEARRQLHKNVASNTE